jgi:DNA-binding transcriptional regulator YdaS (Cro superfamily)
MVLEMDLKTYLSPMSAEQRKDFATRCGASRGHIQNVAYGKKCDAVLAAAIERESGGAVTRQELRADWQAIWPELAEA